MASFNSNCGFPEDSGEDASMEAADCLQRISWQFRDSLATRLFHICIILSLKHGKRCQNPCLFRQSQKVMGQRRRVEVCIPLCRLTGSRELRIFVLRCISLVFWAFVFGHQIHQSIQTIQTEFGWEIIGKTPSWHLLEEALADIRWSNFRSFQLAAAGKQRTRRHHSQIRTWCPQDQSRLKVWEKKLSRMDRGAVPRAKQFRGLGVTMFPTTRMRSKTTSVSQVERIWSKIKLLVAKAIQVSRSWPRS